MATNYKGKGKSLSLACSDPATPASNDPVRFGSLTGVAQIAESAEVSGETTVDLDTGVYALSVKGVNDSGNSAVAAGDNLFYVDADTPKLSKKSSGYFFGVALAAVGSGLTATIDVLHIPGPGSGTLGSGTVGETNLAAGAATVTKIGTAAVTEAKLYGNLAVGFIPLDITTCRILSAGAIQNTTEAGVPDGNTDPTLTRTNGATDIAIRLAWAAGSVVEVQFGPVPKPPDLDDAAALTVHLMLEKDANADTTAVVGVKAFDGKGDTNAGGNTAALAAAALAEYSVTLAAADLGAAPGFLNFAIVPGTHASDAIRCYAAWLEYARKG